jgi:co-chaperonin GroES (HSP10)
VKNYRFTAYLCTNKIKHNMAGVRSMKAFKPMGDRLLLLVHKPDDELLIQPIGYEKHNHVKATVVSIGSKVLYLKNRDVVIIQQQSGTDIVINNVTYRLIRENEIIAKT